MKITIYPRGHSLSAFDLQHALNQEIWEGDRAMRPSIRDRLLEIAYDFVAKNELAKEDIKDIIVTGSLANYNWSSYSDIDLHILIKFEEVDSNIELVKKFFDAVRSNWNKIHDIRVKGHEVEIYVQDHNEPHTSTGVYSIIDDGWIVKPKPVRPHIDRGNVVKKASSLMGEINKIVSFYNHGKVERVLEDGAKLKEKLKHMRQSGLDRGGIFSVENLITC